MKQEMIKQAIIVFLASMLLIAGCSKNDSAPPPTLAENAETPPLDDAQTAPVPEEEQKAPEGKIYATLAEIKAEETPMKCTWTTPQGGSGMARVFGDFIRTESTFGGNMHYMTNDGVYRYTWTKGSAQGTKISTDLQKKMEAEAGTEKIRGEYYCVKEAIPDEGFVPAQGISYIDVGASY